MSFRDKKAQNFLGGGTAHPLHRFVLPNLELALTPLVAGGVRSFNHPTANHATVKHLDI